MERTLVVLKPDTVQRQILGEIITRFEKTGIKIIAMKMMIPDKKLLEIHYSDKHIPVVGQKTMEDWAKYGIKADKTKEEIGRGIVDSTRAFMGSGPVVAMVLEGGHVVEVVRKLVGSTGPKDSAPGTIRGDYAHLSLGRATLKGSGAPNLLHASGNTEEAEAEIKLWFKSEELFDYKTSSDHLTQF